ncbi:MAG: AMP-binding protein [Chloroflexota bacterium]
MAEYYDQRTETMPAPERERHLRHLLSKVLKHAYENAPAVRAMMDGAGVNPSRIKTLRDLAQLPILTRDRLIEQERESPPFAGYMAKRIEDIEVVYVSPGPLYYPQGGPAWHRRQEQCMFTSGMRKGDIAIVTTSYHLVPAGLIFHNALASFGVSVIPAGPGNTELQLNIIRALQVTGIVAFPSFLMILVQKARELGYDWRRDFCLRKAFLIGEVPSAATRQMWEEEYGIATVQSYGFVPIGLVAYECEQKNGMHLADGSLLEIVDPATGSQLGPGECGEVVVTLTDEEFPLIRYGTGDLSCYTDEPCPCGRTSIRLLRIMGRVGEASKVRGMFIHPRQVEDALSQVPEVSRWTVVVGKSRYRDEITLRVETKGGEADRGRLLPILEQRLPELCHLRPDHVEFTAPGHIPDSENKIVLDLRKGRVAEV